MSQAATVAIDTLAKAENIPDNIAARINAEFAEKIRESTPVGLVPTTEAELAQRLRHAAIKAERQELIRIWRDNQISDDVLHHIEEDLDYQESRL